MSGFSWLFCNSCFRSCLWGYSKLRSPLLCSGHGECKMLPGSHSHLVYASSLTKQNVERQKKRDESRGRSAVVITHVSEGLLCRLCNSSASERMFQPTVHSESNCWWHFFMPSSFPRETGEFPGITFFVCMWEADKLEVGFASLCRTKHAGREEAVLLIWPGIIIFKPATIWK